MVKRKWTVEEKINILSIGEKEGILETCRKYGVGTTSYYDWKKRFDEKGIAGLKNRYYKESDEIDIKTIKKENDLLKKLLIEKELELKVKDDLLKKTLQRNMKK